MKRLNYTRLTVFAHFLGLFFLSSVLSAQENSQYNGPYKVGDYQGKAAFNYFLKNNDTILDGSFLMQRSSLEALLEEEDYSFLFKGNFSNNYPNGPWVLQFGEFKSDKQSEVIDYAYRVAISGIQEEAKGSISQGKPDGKWSYEINKIVDSEVEEIVFKSTIDFDKGVPQSSFSIENSTRTLVGRFLRNGLAHDEWALYDSEELGASESWIFDDGVLRSIQLQMNGTPRNIPVFSTLTAATKTVNLDKRYLEALQLQKSIGDTTNIFRERMTNLLEENAAYYKKIDTVLSNLGEAEFLPEFKVKLPFYPLNEEEAQQLDSISSLYRSAAAISTSFLDNSQLNILKLSDKQALYLYSVVAAINEAYLVPLEQMNTYREHGILEFVPRAHLISTSWTEGPPSTTIQLKDSSLQKTSFELPGFPGFDMNTNTLSAVLEWSGYAKNSLEYVQDILNEKLTKDKREQELIAIENLLITQKETLNTTIDSLGNLQNNAGKKALNSIQEISNAGLSTYASEKNVKLKLSSAKALSSCMRQLQTLALAVGSLPEQSKKIESEYQDRIWNPFMANLMNEEVKKRLTAAYRKVLLPYFLDEIQTNLSCDNANELGNLLQETYQQMLLLRNEETSKLERKLKRTTEPNVVLDLLMNHPIGKED